LAKSRRGLDHRHRDKSGRIDKKHGNTRVGSLRKEYGPASPRGAARTWCSRTCSRKPARPRCTNICGIIGSSKKKARSW